MTTDETSEQPVSYGRRLAELAEMQPDATAFIFVTTDGTEWPVTWRQLDGRSNRVARGLAKRGVGQGDMVVIELPNSVEHVVAAFAAWQVGGCVLPLRWDLPAWERERVLAVAEPAIVVGRRTEDGPWQIAAPEQLDDPASSAGPLPDRIPDPARAIASSGSTGVPKVICGSGSGIYMPTAIENSAAMALGQRAGQVQLVMAGLSSPCSRV
jgi:bile acid-coenzyme A ligase